MIKAQLHIHTDKDKEDKFIDYSLKQIIDRAYEKGFHALGIACHNTFTFEKEMEDYAKKKGIILLWGIEKDIEEKHVVILNCDKSAEKISTFKDLKKYRAKNPKCLVIAPHPYHMLKDCLKDEVITHRELFDAYEYSFFYTKWINPNKKTEKVSKKTKKPLIGSSDIHYLDDLELTYSLVDSKKDKDEIISAIKKGKVKIVTNPLSFSNILFRIMKIFHHDFIQIHKRKA